MTTLPAALRRKARSALWKLAARTRPTITTRTAQGRFEVSTRDRFIGCSLFVLREFESKLMGDTFAHLVRIGKAPTGTLLDIGANMGITTVSALTLGHMQRSIAIEPAPGNLALLRRNVALNGLEGRVSVLPVAASDEAGTVELELSDINMGDHRIRVGTTNGHYAETQRATVQVPRKPLDEILRGAGGDVGMAWIDTQGHEGQVFAGGRAFFARAVPTLCEVWPYGLERAGTSPRDFCDLAASFWPSYWVQRTGGFVRYPTTALRSLLDELDLLGHHHGVGNALFTS